MSSEPKTSIGALYPLIRESQGMPKEEMSWGQDTAEELLFRFSFTIWPTSNNAYNILPFQNVPTYVMHPPTADKSGRTTDHLCLQISRTGKPKSGTQVSYC